MKPTLTLANVLNPGAGMAHLALEMVAKESGISVHILNSRSRTDFECYARFVIYRLIHSRGINNSEIGRQLGKHPSTIYYGLNSCQNRMDTDPRYREVVLRMEKEFAEALMK